MRRGPATLYNRYVKRAIDVALSAGALVALSPVIAAIAVAVRHRHGSPILFRQRRGGLGGVPFDIFKFRTMTDERDIDGQLLPDRERVTRLGRWLRETSLDELPELINVLRGEMSLVGPRPLLHHDNERYDARQARRLECRPGLTGWVAVNGRNTRTWDERFEQDVYYVENLGPWLDCLIILKTISTVLSRKGIDPSFADQMPEFQRMSSS